MEGLSVAGVDSPAQQGDETNKSNAKRIEGLFIIYISVMINYN